MAKTKTQKQTGGGRVCDSKPASRNYKEGRLVLITGLAGAGYSTAVHALQDIGYLAIDNLPVSLISRLVSTEIESDARKVAVSIDGRSPGFDAAQMESLLKDIRKTLGDEKVVMVHLTASRDELNRRFNATRRQHPLITGGDAEGLLEAIDLDAKRNAPLAGMADMFFDTSHTSPGDFKKALLAKLGERDKRPLAVVVESFSYRLGIPPHADMVLDMRFLQNPHWVPALAEKTGADRAVQKHIADDKAFGEAMEHITRFLALALARLDAEGRPRFSIATGCTGGRHRSVFAAITLAKRLTAMGYRVRLRHRDLE